MVLVVVAAGGFRARVVACRSRFDFGSIFFVRIWLAKQPCRRARRVCPDAQRISLALAAEVGFGSL